MANPELTWKLPSGLETSKASEQATVASIARPRETLPRPFGRYELRRLLGRGGMAAVYLAYDPQLDRLVALKIPRVIDDDEIPWRERFLTEARAAATLTHPNICPVHEVGEVDAKPYLTMAFIEGETLAERLSRSDALSIEQAVDLVLIVSRAMSEAHSRGIVHRDLKPGNILIDHRGQPIIMDFGLALRVTGADDLRLTLSGLAMGTPRYMSPEQVGGDHDAIGPASDVYSLGVILYEAITGEAPFQAKTLGKLMAQIERDPPPPSLANADVDPALEAILLRTLEKLPANRYSSAGALAEALERYSEGPRAVRGVLSKPRIVLPKARSIDDTATFAKPALAKRPGAIARVFSRQRADKKWAAIAALAGALLVTAAAILYIETNYRPKNQTAPGAALSEGSMPSQKPPARQLQSTPYPAAPTTIALSRFQIALEANRDEMEKWLAARKEAKHSVLWLDCIQVEDKPLYLAIAALDSRQPHWTALLDEPAVDFGGSGKIYEKVGKTTDRVVSMSGFGRGNENRSATLWERAPEQFAMIPDATPLQIAEFDDFVAGHVLTYRLVRPYEITGGNMATALSAARLLTAKSTIQTDLSGEALAELATSTRAAGEAITNLAVYSKKGELTYAAISTSGVAPGEWKIDPALTLAELERRAKEAEGESFRPASITSAAWDGAIRYAALWVKETPDPVEED